MSRRANVASTNTQGPAAATQADTRETAGATQLEGRGLHELRGRLHAASGRIALLGGTLMLVAHKLPWMTYGPTPGTYFPSYPHGGPFGSYSAFAVMDPSYLSVGYAAAVVLVSRFRRRRRHWVGARALQVIGLSSLLVFAWQYWSVLSTIHYVGTQAADLVLSDGSLAPARELAFTVGSGVWVELAGAFLSAAAAIFTMDRFLQREARTRASVLSTAIPPQPRPSSEAAQSAGLARNSRRRRLIIQMAVLLTLLAGSGVSLLVVRSAPPSSSPTPAATPPRQPAHAAGYVSPQAKVVTNTVRRYFGALANGDYRYATRHTTEPLRSMWKWMEDGGCICAQPPVEIQGLAINRLSQRNADVNLDAFSDGIAISGLLMSRINGRWLIDDYAVDGRSIKASVVPDVRASQTIDGLTVRIVGHYVPTAETQAWTIITNHGRAVRTARVEVASPPDVMPVRGDVSSGFIGSGATVLTNISWRQQLALLAGQKIVLQPEFIDAATGRHFHFSLDVTMPLVHGLNA